MKITSFNPLIATKNPEPVIQLFNDTVDTPTSRFNIMISPSGYIFDVIQHKK